MNNQPVLYLQTDPRWSYKPYAVKGESATVGGSGCGPACAAMAIESITGKIFTPLDACNWSMEHGYKALNQGTYYSYFEPQFAAFGIKAKQLNGVNVYGNPSDPTHALAFDMLKDGYWLIACMGKGLWTTSGHFVLVWWRDGMVRINDPASTKPARMNGTYSTFISQVKYYFWIDAREYNKEDEDMTTDEVREIAKEVVSSALVNDSVAKATVSDWAADAWEKAVSKGLFDGTSPGATLTREQAAVLLDRLGALDGEA